MLHTKPGIDMDLSKKIMKGAKRREPRIIKTQYLKVRGEAAREDRKRTTSKIRRKPVGCNVTEFKGRVCMRIINYVEVSREVRKNRENSTLALLHRGIVEVHKSVEYL